MRLWNACLAMLLWAASVQAQATGTIVVTVVDDGSGDALETALVYIPALDVGGMSDAQGRFTIADVPVGGHEVQAGLIGYSTETAVVAVQAGQTATVELRIKPSAFLLEEVAVTGTAFEESPINLPYAVTVVGREQMAEQGSPQAVDFFKNLGASHGVIGEANSWYNAIPGNVVPETVANVNLRGLGASRTLVLLNGRRHTYVPARLIGGRFVDVNAFPSIAIDRLEVLKEGASAIYGSDAVAGVANFVTRDEFAGFEVTGSYDHFAQAGDSNLGAIWGGALGNAHAVLSVERMSRQELKAEERDWTLRSYIPGAAGGWSYYGNPGAFLMPNLSGNESRAEFASALIDEHYGAAGRRFVDPGCTNFGGFEVEDETCRFRYQAWDNLIEKSTHTRAFAEINGQWDEQSSYHFEGLWAEAAIPDWYTTPSFPPISPYDGTHLVESGHPGRQAFCAASWEAVGFDSQEACLADDWYFFGRLVGNSGPERILNRQSRTQRIAAAFDRDLGKNIRLDLAASYSRATGNINFPAEYHYRKFLAFRGFGGPDCGVDVVADANAPADMAIADHDKVAGTGDCMYYNPFSNALQYAQQPGAAFENEVNPTYAPGLANSPELLAWINQEVNLDNTATLEVVDATLTGTWIEDVASYAVGYQFRHFDVSAFPNEPGNLDINPCAVLGSKDCAEKAGSFTFTAGYYPYEDAQTVHRFFGELPLSLGGNLDAQFAANYEFHDVASSFNPKLAVSYRLSESPRHSMEWRGSVQTTFRTPSVDDLNEDQRTSSNWVASTGGWKAIDTRGNNDLVPEQALTYNAGLVLLLKRASLTLDYWSYDFENVIDVLPYSRIADLYSEEATREAVKQYIGCADGVGTGTCDPATIERVQVNLVNWPGLKTSGFDWHLSTRFPIGAGELSSGLDGTYTREYRVRALLLNELELQPAQEAGGYLNESIPIAVPIPQWKWRLATGYHWGTYSLVQHLNYISSYEDQREAVDSDFRTIDPFFTWDLNLLCNLSDGLGLTLSALNLTDAKPPLVNRELAHDGLTHSSKGRRFKLAVTYRFGGMAGRRTP